MSREPVEFMNCEGCGCRIGTFDACGNEKRVYRTKYRREVCPGCGAILCVACACKARRRFHASSEPLFERVGCYACTHGTHPATSR